MRFLPIILMLFVLSACREKHDGIIGRWTVKTSYYSANYKIFQDNDGFHCLVLSYNDGTKRYSFKKGDLYYYFKGLKWQEDKYVDGVSGATSDKKQKSTGMFSIEIIDADKLEVTSRLAGKPKKEIWKRIK